METNTETCRWLVTSASIPGAKRIRRGSSNQDAFAIARAANGADLPIVAAVADGHGSAAYVRSSVGSERAVQIAAEQLLSIALPSSDDVPAWIDVKRAVTERLPRLFHHAWVEEVEEHFATHPLTPEEQDIIQRSRRFTTETLEKNPSKIYGTTVLAVLLTDSYAVFLQLGDGEIVVVESSKTARGVFESDKRFLGDETASMASADAWKDVQVAFHPFVERPPALLMLSTDGYEKAFASQEAFLQVGGDILSVVRAEGFDEVVEGLPTWLKEASVISGDDATAIVLVNQESIALVETLETPDVKLPEFTEDPDVDPIAQHEQNKARRIDDDTLPEFQQGGTEELPDRVLAEIEDERSDGKDDDTDGASSCEPISAENLLPHTTLTPLATGDEPTESTDKNLDRSASE